MKTHILRLVLVFKEIFLNESSQSAYVNMINLSDQFERR